MRNRELCGLLRRGKFWSIKREASLIAVVEREAVKHRTDRSDRAGIKIGRTWGGRGPQSGRGESVSKLEAHAIDEKTGFRIFDLAHFDFERRCFDGVFRSFLERLSSFETDSGLAHSKTWRSSWRLRSARSVLECASPLAL